MLKVFLEELGGSFFEWIKPTTQVMVQMLRYEANSGLRQAVAEALPLVIKAVKEA